MRHESEPDEGTAGRQGLAGAVDAALRGAGDKGPWRRERSLGASQSDVDLIATLSGRYVLKSRMPAEMAEAEARGLGLLADAQAVRVPAVIGWGSDPPFVLLEAVSGGRAYDGAALGAGLAALHRATADAYGLDHDNFIGRTPQENGWQRTWSGFYRERRLGPQIALAARRGLLPAERRRALELLLDRFGVLIDESACRPSLVHGDLWNGNAIAGPSGEPVLIDPAVSYSDREVELAMMRLFGGFGAEVFAAYEAAWPLAPGWRERDPLYRLYHLLNHLNLFGESYGAAVDAVVARLLAAL